MVEIEVSGEEARRIGVALGVDWTSVEFDPDELRAGILLELRQLRHDPADLTDEDELKAFKTAVSRLRGQPDYYGRLEQREAEARAYSESL